MNGSENVVVLGAGLAGLAAALRLAERGCPVQVLEKNSRVGGLGRSLRRDGFTFDLGGHRFLTQDEMILRTVKQLLGDDLIVRQRRSVIMINGKTFSYPLRIHDVLTQLSPAFAATGFADYLARSLRQKIRPSPDRTFEDWVTNRYGRSFYRFYFGPYTEKLWGVSPRRISADWAAQRISLPNLWDVALRLVGMRNGDARTYADQFHYPQRGFGQIAERMADSVLLHGGLVHLGATVTGIEVRSQRVARVHFRQSGRLKCIAPTHVINTIPLPEFVGMLHPAAPRAIAESAAQLRFRSVRFLNIMIEGGPLSPNCWIYIPDRRYPFFRVQDLLNWSPTLVRKGFNGLILEYACTPGDRIWHMPEGELLNRALSDLVALKLLKPGRKVVGYFTARERHAYPIYNLSYRSSRQRVLEHIEAVQNAISIGRQGLFCYNNADHSIAMGIIAAAHILENRRCEDLLELLKSGSYLG